MPFGNPVQFEEEAVVPADLTKRPKKEPIRVSRQKFPTLNFYNRGHAATA
jgi:hypothetical protein